MNYLYFMTTEMQTEKNRALVSNIHSPTNKMSLFIHLKCSFNLLARFKRETVE